MPYRDDIPGYMYPKDFQTIELLAACIPENGSMVEIGSFYGRSSWAWAASVTPSVKVYCIDIWEGHKPGEENFKQIDRNASIAEFKHYVKDCPNIIAIQGSSPNMPWDKKIKPDLVFVDGSHISPDVDNDLKFWTNQLKPTGILCGHDFNPSKWPDVCEAVIQHSESLHIPFRLFEGSTIWYIELGREEFSKTNREILSERVHLEDFSWQPTPNNIQQIRSMYRDGRDW